MWNLLIRFFRASIEKYCRDLAAGQHSIQLCTVNLVYGYEECAFLLSVVSGNSKDVFLLPSRKIQKDI